MTLHALKRWTSVLFGVLIFSLSLLILVEDIRTSKIGNIEKLIVGLPQNRIWTSVGLTASSFFALGCYDILATRAVALGRVPAQLAWLAGAAANAISNTLGFHVVTGTAVRYRLYRSVGLGLPDVIRVISLSWTALALGFVTVFAFALLLRRDGSSLGQLGGVAVLASLGVLIWCLNSAGRTISLASISLPLPPRQIAVAQMTIGALEMAAAIGALFVLLPVGATPSFLGFSAAYITAVLLGIVSNAPGGIGVFEAAMLSFSAEQERGGVLAALVLYRLIYNLMPFGAALLALVAFEVVIRKQVSSTADNVG